MFLTMSSSYDASALADAVLRQAIDVSSAMSFRYHKVSLVVRKRKALRLVADLAYLRMVALKAKQFWNFLSV